MSLQGILLYALLPVAAMLVGSTIATFWPPSPRVRSATQHLTAGVVFAALAGEVLPQLMESHPTPLDVTAGFTIGVATMLFIRQQTKGNGEGSGEEGGDKPAQPNSLVFAVGIDLLVDGLLVGLGFAAGQKTGILLTIALTTEVLFLGLSTTGALLRAGASRLQVIGTVAALTVPLVIGAALGGTLLSSLPQHYFEAVLAFGVAALLYLVTEELLTEAHSVPEVPISTAMFFVGFLAIFLIELVV